MNPRRPPEPYPSLTARPTPPRSTPAGSHAVGGDVDTDLALVRRMQVRDERALGEFYDRWYSVVHSLATRMLRVSDDVEDVIEETFWQVWRQSDRFTAERGSVQTWLLTIARSRALDRLRATRRLREDSIDDTQGGGDAGGQADRPGLAGGSQAQARPDGDPLLDAELSERRRLVVAALAELPGEQREALELAYFGGFSQSEIADRTKQPLGTVKTRMRLAMQKLRDRLSLLRDDAP